MDFISLQILAFRVEGCLGDVRLLQEKENANYQKA